MRINLAYGDENTKFKRPKFKIIFIICIIILIIASIGSSIYFYIFNEQFKGFVDKYIFVKEISSENLKFISLDDSNSKYIKSYNKYIITIEKGKLEAYNSKAKKVFELDININNPLIEIKNDVLIIAENKGQKLYYISNNDIKWEKELEGEILSLHINKNGYVAVILRNTNYKSIIITFDNKGKELFKTWLGKTYAVDVDISNDNKYLAFAEVNTNGSTIRSNIKIISIDKAIKNEEDSYIYTYNDITESLIISIKFQDKNKLICMYNSRIDVIQNNNCEVFLEMSLKDSLFVDVKLDNTVLKANKMSTGLFATQTELTLINTNTKKEYKYTVNGTPKNIYTYKNLIAIDIGTEIHFINTKGWLIKRYSNNREAKDIVLGNDIGGIIYKDKIELLNL